MLLLRYAVLFFFVGLVAVRGREPSILLAMIARNEEDNFRANLPKWRPVIDGMVCGIDDRTSDRTHIAIVESLPDLPRWIYYYRFDGFGNARTRVFQEAWRKFPNMSHVLVADPDWEPEPPMVKAEVDFDHIAFQFKIWDRNAHTTRMSEWLVLHRPGLYFSYRLHEQLQVHGDPTLKLSKQLSWQVREVEVSGRNSWHTSQVDHGHSQSFNRYLFDLDLLEKDRAEMPDDPHVLYYLGATNFAALEALLGRGEHTITPQMTEWIDKGVRYLELRLKNHHVNNPSLPQEQTWAAMRWLAYAYQNFRVDFDQAKHWYNRCVDFDPQRPDCPVFLSKLYRQHGLVRLAWETISEAVKVPLQERRFSNNFYVHQCSLPLETSMTLIELLQSEKSFVDAASLPIFLFGWKLLRSAQAACNSPSIGYLLESEESVATAEAAYRTMAPESGHTDGTSTLDLLDRDELCIETDSTADEGQTMMLRQWGVSFCGE